MNDTLFRVYLTEQEYFTIVGALNNEKIKASKENQYQKEKLLSEAIKAIHTRERMK